MVSLKNMAPLALMARPQTLPSRVPPPKAGEPGMGLVEEHCWGEPARVVRLHPPPGMGVRVGVGGGAWGVELGLGVELRLTMGHVIRRITLLEK